MKKKILAIVLVLVMLLTAACSKNDEKKDEPTAAPTAAVADDTTTTPEPTAVPTEEAKPTEAVAQPTDEPVDEPDSRFYSEDGEMYVEYTENYYFSNVYRGDVAYDLEAYAPIAPFVGGWNIYDEESTVATGYYFFSDGYVSMIYADGTVCPIAEPVTVVDEATLRAENWGIDFTIKDDKLVDSNGNELPFAYIEFPMTDAVAWDFGGYWSKDENADALSDEYLFIDHLNSAFTYVYPGATITGSVQTQYPTRISMIDDVSGEIDFLYMKEPGHLVTTDEENWYFIGATNPDEISGSYEEDDFWSNTYFAVDNEYDAEKYSYIRPFVGYWLISNGSTDYRYDENFEFVGFTVYSDSVWKPVNQNGIPSVEYFPYECSGDNELILNRYDDSASIKLTFDAEGNLVDSEGNIYTRECNTYEISYPLKGTPSELIGYWGNDVDEESIGTFSIMRDGSVTFANEDIDPGITWTVNSEKIMIDAGVKIYFDIALVTTGAIFDENGIAYTLQ